MIRTRDLILFVLILGFLLVAITLTVSTQSNQPDEIAPQASFLSAPDSFSVVSQSDGSDRGGFVSDLRDRIGFFTPPEPIVEPSESVASTTDNLEFSECTGSYRFSLTSSWSERNIEVTLQEGARVVTEIVTQQTPSSATTSTSSAPTQTRTVLFFVPERAQSASQATCNTDNVIGFTPQGQLIDLKAANQFMQSGNELIGYAFDGFPIYGRTTAPLDSCNGQVVAGQYRYHLPPVGGRQECFSGIPVDIRE